jgi:guanylate kinase
LKFSISYTTRQPRQGERNGVDYFFTDRPSFLSMVDRGEFLEWAEFNGNLYGTGRDFVQLQLDAGRDVILDIDVQGARQVKSKIDGSTAIFVLPPSFAVEEPLIEELQERIAARYEFKIKHHKHELYGSCQNPETCEYRGSEAAKGRGNVGK